MGAQGRRVDTRINELKRLQNTKDGNPRYRVLTDAGDFLVSPGSSVSYGIGNSEFRDTPVKLAVRSDGIIGVQTADGGEHAGMPLPESKFWTTDDPDVLVNRDRGW